MEDASERWNFNKARKFSNQQIAFLYLLDPLGIEHYMKHYEEVDSSKTQASLLFFKDNVYTEIFGVEPRYFEVLDSGQILFHSFFDDITDETRLNYYSEAEILFGAHVIWNGYAIFKITKTFLEQVFKIIPKVGDILDALDLCRLMFFAGSITSFEPSGASAFLDFYEEDVPPGVSVLSALDWVGNLLNLVGDIIDPSNIYDIKIYKKVNEKNYISYFAVSGTEMTLDEIITEANNNSY